MGSSGELASAGAVLRDYVGAFVDELVRSGVTDVSLCPGSRSTPLALSLLRQPGLRVWTHLDERSAAFFALGMARALRRPVAVAGTSGTAVVNFAPAVAEGRNAGVPLILLTADRPPELRGIGATQTIDQVHLYGNHVKWSEDLLLPEGSEQALRYARTIADRAVATAQGGLPGPVHLNFPFREPLIPDNSDAAESMAPTKPSVATFQAPRRPSPGDLRDLAVEFSSSAQGLIICGPQDAPGFAHAVHRLSLALGWPVLADVLSQVRCGPHADGAVIDNYDAFLRSQSLSEELQPEAILRFGATPVSRPLTDFLQRHAACPQTLVAADGTWLDPQNSASRVVFAEPASFCHALLGSLEATNPPADQAWPQRWGRAREATQASLASSFEAFPDLNEASTVHHLAELLPDDAIVFAGNSMPVRDLDSFFPRDPRPLRFLANRGASGIDGVVSSALGVAAASQQPTVLLIGDISLYHDSNGLLAARRYGKEINATIVVLNNDGGGIFSFLPQGQLPPEEFEPLFGTPHNLDFRLMADLYGLSYGLAASPVTFAETVRSSLDQPGVSIVEVRSQREPNVALHRDIWQSVASMGSGLLEKS